MRVFALLASGLLCVLGGCSSTGTEGSTSTEPLTDESCAEHFAGLWKISDTNPPERTGLCAGLKENYAGTASIDVDAMLFRNTDDTDDSVEELTIDHVKAAPPNECAIQAGREVTKGNLSIVVGRILSITRNHKGSGITAVTVRDLTNRQPSCTVLYDTTITKQ